MGEPHRRPGFPPEAAVGAFVLAAALPLTRLFSPEDPLGIVAAALALGLVSAWGAERLGRGVFTSWVLSTGAMLWFLGAVFAPETLWGPLPTLETLGELGGLARRAATMIAEEAAPLATTTPLDAAIGAGVWQTTWLVHTAALRLYSPLLAVAGAIPLFVLPGMFLPSPRRVVEVALFLGGAGWLLYVEERRRSQSFASVRARDTGGFGWGAGHAARLGLVALLLAAVAAPMLPGFANPPGPSIDGRGSGRVFFNPLVAIRPTLDRKDEVTLFTVQAARPTYYRLTSLDHFDGKVFSDKLERDLPASSDLVTSPRVSRTTVRQSFTIAALAGPWVPAAQRPLRYPGAFTWDPESISLTVGDGVRAGMSYSIVSSVPQPTADSLDSQGSVYPQEIEPYLALPRLPREVREIARAIAGDEATPFRKALKLQEHLRGFTYDENVAAGHSFDNIVDFLTEHRRGYCEQFSSSMAVLARSLGIPARVVIGFGYGDALGSDRYRITTRQAHAWTEIYFPRSGWISFEPTPRAGVTRTPEYALPLPLDADEPDPEPRSTAGPTRDPVEPEPSAEPTPTPGSRSVVAGPVIPLLAGVAIMIAIVAVLLLLSLVLGRAIKAWRIKHAPGAREVILLEYRDFLAWCADAGFGRGAGETPMAHARRLARVSPGASEPATSLAEAVGAALWAPPNGSDPAAVARDAILVREHLAPAIKRRTRARAALGLSRWRAR